MEGHVTIDSLTRASSYDGASRLTTFNGQPCVCSDGGPSHAVDLIGNADRFDYDTNGNITFPNKGLAGQQTLVWDGENRPPHVQDNQESLVEQYGYDVAGASVKLVSRTATTYIFFVHKEEEVMCDAATAISYDSFGGLRIAVPYPGSFGRLKPGFAHLEESTCDSVTWYRSSRIKAAASCSGGSLARWRWDESVSMASCFKEVNSRLIISLRLFAMPRCIRRRAESEQLAGRNGKDVTAGGHHPNSLPRRRSHAILIPS